MSKEVEKITRTIEEAEESLDRLSISSSSVPASSSSSSVPSSSSSRVNELKKKEYEAYEELKIEADFILEHPLFLTVTETVGNVEKHTDVSLWYVLSLGRNTKIDFDKDEFHSIRWFNINDLPYERSDPHLKRFIEKYSRLI